MSLVLESFDRETFRPWPHQDVSRQAYSLRRDVMAVIEFRSQNFPAAVSRHLTAS